VIQAVHGRGRSRHKQVIIAVTIIVVLIAGALWRFSQISSGSRPSGPIKTGNSRVIEAGDSKARCIDSRLGDPLRQVEDATGINYDCIETFSNADPTWADWVSPWLTQAKYGYTSWLAADPAHRLIILTINVIPDSVDGNANWAAECAGGAYNLYAKQLAANLVRAGFGFSVIRLGAEMNGTSNTGSLGTTVAEWHQWARCFAQEVGSMRAVHGSHLLFDWNVNANYRNIPLAEFYPGDSYVDIVGIDAYDDSGVDLPPVGSPARWGVLASEPDGLNAVEAFAAAHHKPLSLPEWGTVESQGDDASYVSNMATFIAGHDVAFQSWFNAGDNGILQLSRSQAPRSLAAYKGAFG
jgi:hypothetical protein